MTHPTPDEALDVAIDGLPIIDEHSVEIRADPARTWEALGGVLPHRLDGRRGRVGARALGSAFTKAQGDPSVIGSTLPGFVVSRSVRPALLALLGQHRFSRYALVFTIDDLGGARSRLTAETRAEFPGRKGRAYRGLVIGTRGHVVVVRHLLKAVRARAERSIATIDHGHVARWMKAYEHAWRTEGTDALDDLFSSEVLYSTGPFQKPHIGLDAVKRMWEAERTNHEEIFGMHFEIVAVEADTGVTRVTVHYENPRQQEYRDLWIIRLDEHGRCFHFEEWPFWPAGTPGVMSRGAEAETMEP